MASRGICIVNGTLDGAKCFACVSIHYETGPSNGSNIPWFGIIAVSAKRVSTKNISAGKRRVSPAKITICQICLISVSGIRQVTRLLLHSNVIPGTRVACN